MKKKWTNEDKKKLTTWCMARPKHRYGKDIETIAKELGRTVTAIHLKISRYGLGNRRRVTTEGTKDRRIFKGDTNALHVHQSKRMRAYIHTHGHPKGMLGKQHSQETKDRISKTATQIQADVLPLDREIRIHKMLTTKEMNGTLIVPQFKDGNMYSRTKGGKREDLDNQYFRSAWEANYARYLNFLIDNNEIKSWEFEPETFWFKDIKRGCRSYTPDFKITNNNDEIEWHEVKGWMDKKSKTKLKRMKKYHPNIQIIVIGEDEYKAISKWKAMIPNWE